MFVELRLELETEKKDMLFNQKAVILQSILMEQISAEYAAELHESGLHPYSQAVVRINDKNIWYICTTSEEAYHKIIEPLAREDFSEFYIERDEQKVIIKEKQMTIIEENEFMDKYYFEDGEKYVKILFRTPVAFKQTGQYIFYPDLRLIYQSLMNKYDASGTDVSVKCEEVLEQLVQYSQITQYDLKSCFYNIGKVRIPAFVGSITVKVTGPQTMVNFVNMLFRFGEYSGIGIKTAMGMGKISVMGRY